MTAAPRVRRSVDKGTTGWSAGWPIPARTLVRHGELDGADSGATSATPQRDTTGKGGDGPMTAPLVQLERPVDDARGSDTARAIHGLPTGVHTGYRAADRPEVLAIARPGVVLLQLLIAGAGWWSVVALLGGEPTLLRGLLLIACLAVAASATVAVIGSFAFVGYAAFMTSTAATKSTAVIGSTDAMERLVNTMPARSARD